MPGADDGRVVLVIEGGAAKVNDFDSAGARNPDDFPASWHARSFGTIPPEYIGVSQG